MNALKKLGLLAALSMLGGCRTMTASAGIDTSCFAFEPITYSAKDTPVTIEQVREHNAAFSALCPVDQAGTSVSLTDR